MLLEKYHPYILLSVYLNQAKKKLNLDNFFFGLIVILKSLMIHEMVQEIFQVSNNVKKYF